MARGVAEQQFHSYEVAKKWVDSWIVLKGVSFSRRGIHMLPGSWEKVIAMENTFSDMFFTFFK